jgi:aerobic-type carbon monoxide dehydrogenase small subunit (CoxS/CutS family)
MNYLDCSFNVNGNLKLISIIEDKSLIFVIRDEFGLTGTKLGCGLEQCGSCAVLIDGEKKLSCNLLAKDYQNCEITTIEGLESDKGLNTVQKAFKEFNAAQCGYCTSGIIVSLTSLFKKNKNPSKDEINKSLLEHLCRCGSHNAINKAINKIKNDLN